MSSMEVLGTGILDAVRGVYAHTIRVASGIYASVYTGEGNDGWLKTYSVDDAGNIGGIIAFLEFDTASGYYPRITEARPGMFAIAYWKVGTGGTLKTVDIDAAGNIGAVRDTLMFDVASVTLDIVTIATGIVAIFYRGAGDHGWIKTYPIDVAGTIGAMIDEEEFDAAYAETPRVISRGGGDIYIIVYTGEIGGHNTGEIATVDIDSAGNIGAVQDSWVFDPADGNNPMIAQVSGDVHCIVYSRDVAGEQWGRMPTINVETDGTITGHAFINDFYFDIVQGKFPNIIYTADTTYAIAYSGESDHGYIILIEVANDGTIGSITDTLEFDDYSAHDIDLVLITTTVYLISYWKVNGLGEGILKTIGTVSLPTTTTDPATLVTANSATPNGTLDNDGGEACDCGFQWGETIAYGNTTPTQSRTTGQTFAQAIAGLDPNKTYHFRAFATNGAGTSYGADRTFTTLGAAVGGLNPAFIELLGY